MSVLSKQMHRHFPDWLAGSATTLRSVFLPALFLDCIGRMLAPTQRCEAKILVTNQMLVSLTVPAHPLRSFTQDLVNARGVNSYVGSCTDLPGRACFFVW